MANFLEWARRIVRGLIAAAYIFWFVAVLQSRPIRTMFDVTFGVVAFGFLVWAILLVIYSIRGDR